MSPTVRELEVLLKDAEVSAEEEAERRKLWRNAAVAASANYLTLDQPAKLADAVLAAYDRKFLGREPEPTEKVTEPTSMDPVDVIREAFGG